MKSRCILLCLLRFINDLHYKSDEMVQVAFPDERYNKLMLCSIYGYDDVSSRRFDDTSIDTAGPVSILWHVCSSGPHLI